MKPIILLTLCATLLLDGVLTRSSSHAGVFGPSGDVPYVPTQEDLVLSMLNLANVGPGDVVYDLGCGDGRIAIMAARCFGARAVGVDINPERIRESVANANKWGVARWVHFKEQDLFETDIRDATVLTLYLLPSVNARLRPKLLTELRPGTRIVSHSFDMGDWAPDRTDSRIGTIHYWVVPANVSGVWHLTIPTARGSTNATLELIQKFQNVSGTLTVNGRRLFIRDARLEGDQLHFELNEWLDDQGGAYVFDGLVRGEAIEGAMNDSQSWSGRRRPGTANPLDATIER